MTSIQIRDLPEEVHDEYVRRAHDARQSLQQYMRALLIDEARRPSMSAVLARAAENAHRWGGSYGFDEALADLHQAREERQVG
jgi:antitoxin FitA